MSFGESRFLYLLFLLIPWIGIAYYQYVHRGQSLRGLFDSAAGAQEMGPLQELHRRYILSTLFFLVFYVSLVVALAEPRWGFRLVSEYRQGLDVVIALDISRSMDVRDVPPSRLGRALEIAQRTVTAAPGNRYAVVLGKGDGILAIPLTDDGESLQSLFRVLSSRSLSSPGTNLERLLDTALSAFKGNSSAQRRILLFSDGEALSGSLNSAVERLKANDISVVAVGVGTPEGMPVPQAPGSSVPLQRADGSPVVSQLRPQTLTLTALGTGGIYVDGQERDAVDRVVGYLNSIRLSSVKNGYRKESLSHRSAFLMIALIAFGLSKWVEQRGGKKR